MSKTKKNKSVREELERINIPKRDEIGKLHYYKNIEGKRFGRLIAVKYLYTKNKRPYWICKCDCGNEKVASYGSLRAGNTKSCGCLHYEKSKSRIKTLIENNKKYKRPHEKRIAIVFNQMKRRCYSQNCNGYKNYGGRGIKICDEWLSNFNCFYEWALNNGFKEELSIDRIDVNGNYEPNNCRWVTNLKQQNNKRNNRFVEVKGKKHTIAEWSRITGINKNTIFDRLKRNWDLEEVVGIKPHKKRSRWDGKKQ